MKTQITVGNRYYYTGDQANSSDFGIITELSKNKWGEFFSGKLDDGRIQKSVYLLAFNKGPGQRFKTIDQYNEEREESLKNLSLAMIR